MADFCRRNVLSHLFRLEKKDGNESCRGMWFDMVISLPVATWFAVGVLDASGDTAFNGMVFGLMMFGLGLLSAVSLACMVTASRQLSLGLFGLLTYVEPALLIVVSLWLGERVHPSQWLTYGCIFAAILILIVEGVRNLRYAKRQRIDIAEFS